MILLLTLIWEAQQLPIFKNYWKTHKIKSSDWNSGKNVYDCSVNKFHEIVPKDLGFKSYEIILENGDKIKATQEHPFYTKESNRIEAKDLKVGDYLVGYEEDLPPIDYKTGITILSEIDVKKVIPLKTNSNNVIKYLKKLNLIDIKCNDKKQIILALVYWVIYLEMELYGGMTKTFI